MAGLYLHIPFCAKRCIYCDFFSNTDQSYKEVFIDALIEEMAIRKEYLDGERIETIYFGGGTPSQLDYKDFIRIFEAIENHFDISKCKEITLEANPDDMTSEYVQSLQVLPFNRISMGVQSFDDEDLKFLNRRHNTIQAIEAVELCKRNGLSNISIDLIYGLPGQNEKKWIKNLEEVLRLDIPHISAYHLIYEEGTALHKLMEAGKTTSIDEEISLSLFTILINQLSKAGYQHYEISNFARPGYISQHNSAYWHGKKYLGLGPSAHSYNIQNREWNISSLPEYLKGIKEKTPRIEEERLTIAEKYNDYIITRLRTMWGISYQDLQNNFGEKYLLYCQKQAKTFLKRGLLIEKNGHLFLSHEGIFLSDGIMSEMIYL